MDAVTVLGSAAQLVLLCSSLSKTFQQAAKGNEPGIGLLFREMESLSEVLNSIRSMDTFSSPRLAEYWPTLVRSMKDCEDTLRGLERIVEAFRGSKHGFLGRVRMQIKWEAKAADISLARERISSHRQAMSLTLQLMTMYASQCNFSDVHRSSLLSADSATHDIATRLDSLTLDMNRLLQLSGSQIDSVIDPEEVSVSQQGLRDIENWIPDPSDEVEEPELPGPSASLSDVEGVKSGELPDYEKLDLDESLQHWRESALLTFNRGNYDQAETFLQMLLKFSEGANRQKDESLELLGLVYCRLGRWDKAEKVAEIPFKGSENVKAFLVASYTRLDQWEKAERIISQQFHGRDETLELLGLEFCQQGKLDNVNRILSASFTGRAKVVETLTATFLKNGEWAEAQKVILNNGDIGPGGSAQLFSLAKGLYEQKKFEDAEYWCHRAASTRKAIVGDKHVLYYLAIELLVRIYTARGLSVAGNAYQDLLPMGIQGIQRLSVNFDDRMLRYRTNL
jgi:tetratricopeptide (TPR) repeat protein